MIKLTWLAKDLYPGDSDATLVKKYAQDVEKKGRMVNASDQAANHHYPLMKIRIHAYHCDAA